MSIAPQFLNHYYSFNIILVVIFGNRFLVAITLFLLKNTILRIVEHWILGTFAMKKVSPECEKTHPSCVIDIER